MKRLLGLAAIVLATAGCPSLYAVSSAPPLTSAELDLVDDRIELSKGVALAIDCYDPWWGGPCEELAVTVDDPSIATVARAHLDKYRDRAGFVYDPQSQRSVFVVAGVSPGQTTLRIESDDGDRTLEVWVRDDTPGPRSAAPAL
jgi:hypothetical protein